MKLWICLVCVGLLLACSGNVQAQYSDSVHYNLRFSGTGILNRTDNSQSYLLTNALRFGARLRKVDLNAGANYLYGQQDGNLKNNDFNSTVDVNIRGRFIPRLYYWGLGSFEKSYSLRVNNRTQAGGGLAYSIVDRGDSLFINLSDGVLYEYSDLQTSDTSQTFSSIARNSFRLRMRYRLAQRLTFESTSFVQHSLQDGSDYILRSNNSLNLKLRKWLSLTSALTYNKVSRTGKENLLLTFGITLDGWF
jgi:hypothetical protein